MIKGLNQLDAAILLEKYIVLNGMIHYGTAEEKIRATKEFEIMEKLLLNHLEPGAFELATQELGVAKSPSPKVVPLFK